MSQLSNVLMRAAQPNASFSEEERGLLALYGAAYKVVYEKLQPGNCGNNDWPKLCGRAQTLLMWIATQEPQIREVYEQAVNGNTKRAVDRIESMRRGMRMSQLYNEIPKPPL